MTKVQIHLGLQRPLDEQMMKRIRDANSIYGIERIQVLPSLTELMVEYDATRLKPAEVEKALTQEGIPAAKL
jgi:allophanate hydrolase subunit 1